MMSPRHHAFEALRALPAVGRTHPFAIFPALLALLCVAIAVPAQAATKVESDQDKTFYFIGTLTAPMLEIFALSDDELELVLRGIRDTLRGESIALDQEEFAPKLRLLQEERQKVALAIEAKKSGEYLVQQSKLEGAESTPSGLIFTELEAGSGEKPAASSKVRVKYEGRLRDGTIFDAGTTDFPLDKVIPCWKEGVSRVKVGGKARLVCPAEIAYGNRGAPPKIRPGAALTFDVELLEIVEGGE